MDTATPPPIVQPPSPAEQRARFGPIVRDIVIVWVLTVMGGFVVGFATRGQQRDPQRAMLAIAASNFLLGTVAFTISGCLAPRGRWRHLVLVAVGAWLTSLINVVFFGVGVGQWIASAIFMGVVMGIGGAISYAFKRDTNPSV